MATFTRIIPARVKTTTRGAVGGDDQDAFMVLVMGERVLLSPTLNEDQSC